MSGVLRYEWVRISTVRSTWLLIILAVLVSSGLALLVAWLAQMAPADGGGPPRGANESAFSAFLPIAAAVLCTIGAAAFGQEYRHGLIRITLATFPRRSRVYVAKVVMVVLVVALASVVAIAAIAVSEAIGQVIAGADFALPGGIIGETGILGIIYVVLFVLIAFAITALTRNQPLGIITPIVLAVLIEPIVGIIALAQNWTWIDWVLPFSGGAAALSTTGAEAWGHAAVFAAWFLALAIPSWILFLRRDA